MGKVTADFFFNRREFVMRENPLRVQSFRKGNAAIYFTCRDTTLISVDRSTFGGFIIEDHTTVDHLHETIHEAISWAKQNNFHSIIIRCFPEHYAPEAFDMSDTCLKEVGFDLLYDDVTQILSASTETLRMNVHRKRRLRQSLEKNFRFEKCDLRMIDDAYRLFKMSRDSKGYPITMSLENFQDSFKEFPNDYLLFSVFDNECMIATCVCVRVNSKILYCFYIGDDLAYRKWSPVTMLIDGVYNFAQENGFMIIDLGISTDKGILNKSLHDFKKSFGAFDDKKLTYQLKL